MPPEPEEAEAAPPPTFRAAEGRLQPELPDVFSIPLPLLELRELVRLELPEEPLRRLPLFLLELEELVRLELQPRELEALEEPEFPVTRLALDGRDQLEELPPEDSFTPETLRPLEELEELRRELLELLELLRELEREPPELLPFNKAITKPPFLI